MKLALDSVLVGTDDEPAKDEKGNTVNLRQALIRAVLTEFDGEGQAVKGEDKIRRYDLYKLVKKATSETDFSPEDVVALRKAALVYPPLSAGQIRDLLS
jgi:hypothetical protein